MAFLLSDKPREPFLRAPASVLLLIAALVAAHVVRTSLPDPQSEDILNTYAFNPARLLTSGGPHDFVALAVPFISHTFLHADYTHLAVNCLWLLAFGPVVARRFGTGLFLLFFAICGVAGAAAYLALNWDSPAGVIGASGAISGIMAAGIRLFPWQGGARSEGPAPILSSQILIFTAVWLATNLIYGLTGFGADGGIHQIAWQAHVGGFAAGLLLTGPFAGRPREPLAVD